MHGICVVVATVLVGAAPPVSLPSPAGLWATFDDRSGQRRSLIEIRVEDGRLQGTIARVYPGPGEDADPICERCDGARRGARVVGMVILWGHRPKESRWDDGRVLDPENGKEYASSVWLENPEALRVRGSWGPFYRTQTWRRVKETDPPARVRAESRP